MGVLFSIVRVIITRIMTSHWVIVGVIVVIIFVTIITRYVIGDGVIVFVFLFVIGIVVHSCHENMIYGVILHWCMLIAFPKVKGACYAGVVCKDCNTIYDILRHEELFPGPGSETLASNGLYQRDANIISVKFMIIKYWRRTLTIKH